MFGRKSPMGYMILCALMNVGIFTAFRLFPQKGINTFQAIVFNYLVCVITGMVFSRFALLELEGFKTWMIFGFLLGAVFIGAFYLMAITTQKLGITVASVANKISLVIPVVFALFIFNLESKVFTPINYIGLVCTLLAIYYSSVKAENAIQKPTPMGWIIYPTAVFLLGGIIDTTINYTNYTYLTFEEASIFPIFIFASATMIGIIALFVQRTKIRLKSIAGGLGLGIINYFSVYFMLLTLSSFGNDGAVVFPILNLVIIAGSTFISVLFFGEKLSKKNKIGLVLAFLAIFLVSYQELLGTAYL